MIFSFASAFRFFMVVGSSGSRGNGLNCDERHGRNQWNKTRLKYCARSGEDVKRRIVLQTNFFLSELSACRPMTGVAVLVT